MTEPRVLVAGIGNIFQGDDAFGVEVVRRLERMSLPGYVVVREFGIRGFDVACALSDGWDMAILVDCLSRRGKPGTVYVLEPDADEFEGCAGEIQPHGLEPVQALRLARSLGALPPRLVVVGCEPSDLGGEDGKMGLSGEVEAAVEVAAATIERLVKETAPAVGAHGGAR